MRTSEGDWPEVGHGSGDGAERQCGMGNGYLRGKGWSCVGSAHQSAPEKGERKVMCIHLPIACALIWLIS